MEECSFPSSNSRINSFRKLVSGSTDKLATNLTAQIHQGLSNEETGNYVPIKVHAMVTCGTHVIIASGSKVLLYKYAGLKLVRSLSQRQGTVRSLAVEPEGLVAIGSDENDIHLVNIFNPSVSDSLSGHKNAVKSLAFHPTGSMLISGDAAGIIKIWTKPWRAILSLTDLIPASVPEDTNYYPISWDPSGKRYVVVGAFGDVQVLNKDHKKSMLWKHSEAIDFISFSPNGEYLACLGKEGLMVVWKVSEETKVVEHKHVHPITSCVWSTTTNSLYLADAAGEVWYYKDVITDGLSAVEASKKRDELFGEEENEVDDELNDLGPFMDMQADEDMEDNFVVDDDGAGYKEDIQSEQGYSKYQERSKKEGYERLDRLLEGMDDRDEDLESVAKIEEQALQNSFQPGSIPAKGNRHYLTLNLVGTICIIENGETYTIDVDFHEATRRPFHFSDTIKYTMGALNTAGCVLASEASTTDSSTVFFRQMDSWTTRNEWSVTLPDEESVVAVGVSEHAVVVATDQQYLRIFSPSGIQMYIKSMPGPVVTVAAQGSLVLIVFHTSGMFHGNSSMSYQLIDMATMKTVKSDFVCISPRSQLSWVGFTESGIPLTYDSLGVLRGLFVSTDGVWTPLFDLRSARKVQSDWYFPVGANDTQMYCVVCRNDKYPSFHKPIIIDVPLSIPFCQLESERAVKEQQLLHHRLFLTEYKNTRDQVVEETARRELEMDKIILPLFLAACKGQLSQRALELSFDLSHIRSLEGAIRIAANNHLQGLTERLMTLKEVRSRELEAEDTLHLQSRLFSQVTQKEAPATDEYEQTRTQFLEPTSAKKKRNPIAALQEEDEPSTPAVVESAPKTTEEKKKKRNPFATKKEVNNEVAGEPKSCFDMIQPAKEPEVVEKPVADKKRKQTTLFDLVKAPSIVI
jgi:chromosome transmission fidelity protein 4